MMLKYKEIQIIILKGKVKANAIETNIEKIVLVTVGEFLNRISKKLPAFIKRRKALADLKC
jgi:hypothetical protein